jgi:hypothetical protein
VQQVVLGSGGSTTICQNPVSGKYYRFYPPAQTPNTGDIGFQGFVWNVSTGAAVPNTDYYLEWFVTAANKGCCTAVPATPPTDVTCPVTPGLLYKFTAHFKSGKVPPTGTILELRGAWIQ